LTTCARARGCAGSRYPFLTQQERDVETGLDYFEARYYASTQGRFISVDPLGSSAIVSDPQSFNRYTYVLNNPLKYIDPDGLDAQNPWNDLSDEERKRLASKFTTVKDASNPTAEESTAAGQAFNNTVQVVNKDGSINEELTNSNVASVQNFVTSLSGDSNVWNQITSIDKVGSRGNGRQSDINFSVRDREDFFDALRQTTDQFGNRRFFYVGSELLRHEFSARGVGYGASDPSMHIGRDGAAETNLGVHWDNGSPLTYPSASEYLKDQIFLARRGAAGIAHFGPRAKISRVRQHMSQQGLKPLR
jgi:RHS repeat-associated protein